MQQTISYININNKNHQSLYKYYYIKKLNKNLVDIHNFVQNTNYTNFMFYGNRRAIPPLKRIECNKFFNKNPNEIKVNLSILPYNSFQSILRFSSMKSIKNRLKGEVFYQIEKNSQSHQHMLVKPGLLDGAQVEAMAKTKGKANNKALL